MSDQIQNIKIRFVADADFSDLDQSLNKLTAEEKALKDQLKGVDEAAKSAGKSLNEETNKANEAVGKTNKGVGDLKNNIGQLSQQIPGAFQVERIQQFGTQINTSITSVKGLVTQMGLLKVAFAATGIGLLVASLVSLYAYFQKTEQGSEMLERGLASIGAAVDVVIGKFANLGKGIVQLFSGEWKNAVETFRHAFDNIGQDILKAAKAANDFTNELQDIEDAEKLLSVEIAKTRNEIEKLIIQSKNRTATEEERLAFLKQAEQLETGIINKQIELQERKVAALQKENALKVKNGELDKGNKTDELITAEIELENLRGNSLELLERIHNREDALFEARMKKMKDYEDFIKLHNQSLETISTKTNNDEVYKYLNTDTKKRKISKDQQDYFKKLNDAYVEEIKKANDKEIELIKQKEAVKKGLVQQSFTLAVDIANGLFELQKQNTENELSDLDKKHQTELARVGDNKQAQAIINAKFAKQEAEIKTKQAQADKAQALFSIGIKTAQAIIAQMAATPLPIGAPLVALVAATGAAQLAIAASKPIPKFNKGTKSVPGFDTGDDSVYAMLRPGEGVMPVDRMKDYRPAFNAIFDRKIPASLLNSFVMDYGNLDRMISVSSSSNEIGALKSELRAMNKKLDKLQVLQVNMDQKGFKTYLSNENSKSQIENNYYRVG